jgi:hypothetical protein
MWPFSQELPPTQDAPITSEEQAYVLPAPEMHTHAETETEGPHGLVTGMQSGPIDHQDIMNAVGHYAENALHLDDPTYASTEDIDQRKKNGATRVREGYGGEQKNVDLQVPIDLSSADDRLKFLNGFTQGGADDPNSANMCGPTSLIGGAVLANGANGVGTLLDAVDKLAPPGKEDVAFMKSLRAKLDPQNPIPLTGADMQDAQKYIYERLNAHEGLDVNDPDAMKAATESQRGIDPMTMKNLFQTSPELSALYKENHMEIAGIDLGGANGMAEDHAVLRMSDEDGKPLMIFDPAQRKHGQVTGRNKGWSGEDSATIDNGLADYDYARRGGTGPD